MRGKAVITIILVFLFMSPFVVTSAPVIVSNVAIESDHCIAEADVDEMFLDVELYDEPEYHITGTSGEFSYFHSAFYDDDDGVAMMHWDHVANTSVTSDDGVYFQKSFEWSVSEYPRSMYINFEAAFDMSGDFTYSSPSIRYGRMMFWLISPSGQEHSLGYHYSVNGYIYYSYTLDCRQYIDDIWYELVSDPSSYSNTTFTLRVGLYPGLGFLSGDPGNEPWRHTTGSMILLIKRLGLVLTEGTPEDADEVATPVYENNWKTSPANKPDYPPNLGISDAFRGLVSLDDGSIVSAIHSREQYNSEGFDDLVLVRWGPETHIQSYTRVPDYIPTAIDSDGQYVYVTGYRSGNAFLSKWTASGQLLWNNTWDFGMDERGAYLAVDTTGSVYLYVTRYNETSWNFVDSTLFKIDSEGTEEWSLYLNQTWITKMYTNNGTSLFTLESGYDVKERDSSGSVIRVIEDVTDFRPDDRDLITVRNQRIDDETHQFEDWSLLTLNRIGESGETDWSTNLTITYFQDFKELVLIEDVEIAPDGSILLLLQLRRYANEYRLYRYFENGSLDMYQLVGWMPRYGVWDPYDMIALRNGLAYISALEYQTFGESLTDALYILQAYNYTDYTPPVIPVSLQPFVYAGVGISVLIAVILVVRRKRAPM